MAKLTGDNIKAGMSIWIKGYAGWGITEIVPVEVIVTTGIVFDKDLNALEVRYAQESDRELGVTSCCYTAGFNHCIFLGDAGVRPYNYNSRPTQVFTTRKELEAAIIEWDGKNPNFLEGE